MWPSQQNGGDNYSYTDSEWYKQQEAARKSRYRKQIFVNAGYGYIFGQCIGTTAFVLQTRSLGNSALGAGVVLGACMSVGFVLRSL